MSDTNPTPPPSGATPPNPPPPGARTFSQDELSAIATREKEEGRRAGEKAAVEALGFKDTEEAKNFIAQIRKDQEANMSETERNRREAERKVADADAKEQQADRKLFDADVLVALISEGAPRKSVDRIAPMLGLDFKNDHDDKKIAEAVKDLKKEFPALFTIDGEGGSKPPGSHPAAPPSKKQDGELDPQEKAKKLLWERHPQTKPKSA